MDNVIIYYNFNKYSFNLKDYINFAINCTLFVHLTDLKSFFKEININLVITIITI